MRISRILILVVFLSLGCSFQEERAQKKSVEVLVQQSGLQSLACKPYVLEAKAILESKTRDQVSRLKQSLEKFPGRLPAWKEVYSKISKGELDPLDSAWVGKQLSELKNCSPETVYHSAKTLLNKVQDPRFAVSEKVKMKRLVSQISQELLSAPGSLLEMMMTSSLIQSLSEPAKTQLEKDIHSLNAQMAGELLALKDHLSKQYRSIQSEDLSALGKAIVVEAKNTEKIRLKYAEKLKTLLQKQ